MYEYETFVYLDLQKTGSTFIRNFLRAFCKENPVRIERHAVMPPDYDRSKFYFISVREPLDQYLSLFSFGCKGDGQFYNKLSGKGYGGLYDGTWRGFCRWLDFVLRPENARLFGEGYGKGPAKRVSELIGFQSYRVLTYAVPDTALIADCETKDALNDAYRTHTIVGHIVRLESLRADLLELVTGKLRDSISDFDGAIKFIRDTPPVNASDRIDQYEKNPELSAKLRQRLDEREWLMYRAFGY